MPVPPTFQNDITPQAGSPIPPETETPIMPVPPTVQTNVSCDGMTLYLDPVLASGYDCQTIPEASGADLPSFGVNPEYVELTLQGYALANRFFKPHIDVFPVQRYSVLLPDFISQREAMLQALISGGAVGESSLPILPIFNAGQEFHTRYQVIPFENGNGIRFITQYSQATMPINNHEMFYTFQGLTSDGKYWVSAVLPISHPILPESGDTPPGGQSWEDFSNKFNTYLIDIANQLNAQASASFSPTIPILDALITTISIQP